jgi:RNA polymerase sigma factor (sigma-70 family)
MPPESGSTLRTRATLLFRVREWQDGESWEEFHRLYRRLVYGRARRAGLAHEDAEDVAQDVFKRVAETIKDFDTNPERGSFRGWLMKLTHWRIADKFESKGKTPVHSPAPAGPDGTTGGTGTLERVPSPEEEEGDWDSEWQQHVLAMALERLARQVKPRHFQVFELYVRQGWPVLKVSRELRINPASVYVIGHRLTKLLKDEVEKLKTQVG